VASLLLAAKADCAATNNVCQSFSPVINAQLLQLGQNAFYACVASDDMPFLQTLMQQPQIPVVAFAVRLNNTSLILNHFVAEFAAIVEPHGH